MLIGGLCGFEAYHFLFVQLWVVTWELTNEGFMLISFFFCFLADASYVFKLKVKPDMGQSVV
jgi:hypothetical protein